MLTKQIIISLKLGLCDFRRSANSVLNKSKSTIPPLLNSPEMVKQNCLLRLQSNLIFSKASGSDCIPVMLLKNCEPKFSYILAELFNMCLKEFCFPNCWEVPSVVPVFKNTVEIPTA